MGISLDYLHLPRTFTPPPEHPESREFPYGRLIIPFAEFWMTYVQRLRATVEHPERIPTSGGAILAINHTGYWDFVYGGIPAAVNGGRLVRFMAKKEIFDVRVAGALMRAMKHIPVDRAAGADSMAEAVRRVRAGQLVGIFPEATISRSFEVKELRPGAARIAREGVVPLIPVGIWGSQRVWTKGRKPVWRPKDARLVVSVGEPIEVTEDALATTERLREAMRAQLKEAQDVWVAQYGPMPVGEFWVPASLGGGAPALDVATAEDRRDLEERKRKRAEELARREQVAAQGGAPGGRGGVLGGVVRRVRRIAGRQGSGRPGRDAR